MLPRLPEKKKVGYGVKSFLRRVKLKTARWKNPDGGCQVLALLAGLMVLPRYLLKLISDSDNNEKPLFRPSLAAFINDADTVSTDQWLPPDNNLNFELIMRGNSDLEESIDGSRELDPSPWHVCNQFIFSSLDKDYWSQHLYTNFAEQNLVDLRACFQKHTHYLVRTVPLVLKFIPIITEGLQGNVAFLIQLGIKKEKEVSGHAIVLYWNHEERKLLKNCNGCLDLVEMVPTLETLLSDTLPGWTVKNASIRFVIGCTKVDSKACHDSTKGIKDIKIKRSKDIPLKKQEKIPHITENPQEVEEKENKDKNEDDDNKENEDDNDRENEEDNDEEFDDESEPMLTIIDTTITEMKNKKRYEITFNSAKPGKFLMWKAIRKGNKLVCNGHRGKCSIKSKQLPPLAPGKEPTIRQLKKVIVKHRKCVFGTTSGPQGPFPRQRRKVKKNKDNKKDKKDDKKGKDPLVVVKEADGTKTVKNGVDQSAAVPFEAQAVDEQTIPAEFKSEKDPGAATAGGAVTAPTAALLKNPMRSKEIVKKTDKDKEKLIKSSNDKSKQKEEEEEGEETEKNNEKPKTDKRKEPLQKSGEGPKKNKVSNNKEKVETSKEKVEPSKTKKEKESKSNDDK